MKVIICSSVGSFFLSIAFIFHFFISAFLDLWAFFLSQGIDNVLPNLDQWYIYLSVCLCIILGSINTKSSPVLCKQSGPLQILIFLQYPSPWNLLRYPYPYFLVHSWNYMNYYPILQMKTSFWYYWTIFDICKWTVQIDIIVGPI